MMSTTPSEDATLADLIKHIFKFYAPREQEEAVLEFVQQHIDQCLSIQAARLERENAFLREWLRGNLTLPTPTLMLSWRRRHEMITEQQLGVLRTTASAAQKADMDIGMGANVVLALLSEIEALRAVLSAARSSYDVNYHPAEEGDLYQAIAAYNRLVGGS